MYRRGSGNLDHLLERTLSDQSDREMYLETARMNLNSPRRRSMDNFNRTVIKRTIKEDCWRNNEDFIDEISIEKRKMLDQQQQHHQQQPQKHQQHQQPTTNYSRNTGNSSKVLRRQDAIVVTSRQWHRSCSLQSDESGNSDATTLSDVASDYGSSNDNISRNNSQSNDLEPDVDGKEADDNSGEATNHSKGADKKRKDLRLSTTFRFSFDDPPPDGSPSPIKFSLQPEGELLRCKLGKRNSIPAILNAKSKLEPKNSEPTCNLKSFQFVLVGSGKVGKSTLVGQFLHGLFIKEYVATVSDSQDYLVTMPGKSVFMF